MKVIVTCGPAFEPIDTTRRITNISTGRLGAFLAGYFLARGHEVVCLRGAGATFRNLAAGVALAEFGTNADLAGQLAEFGKSGSVGALFHAAALCDFGVAEIRDAAGRPVPPGKIPSRAEGYQLLLKPLPKLLGNLRALFPRALLVGWKYETEGGREKVMAAGRRQIGETRTDLCVLNGAGYGPGFGLLAPDGTTSELPGSEELAAALALRLDEAESGRKTDRK